ncbi:MAG: protein kinase [Chloroflexota bacterium]
MSFPLNAPVRIANRYTLIEEIGRGATGVIYRGVDEQTAVPIAVKMLNDQLVASDTALLARFRQEGKLLRRLDHPNIVKMVAMEEENGRYFLIMEYMPGGDLRQHLQQHQPLPLGEVLNIALDLADALTRTHRLNILHRDLKPANVLMDSKGSPRLTDFGVARAAQADNLTEQGAIVGTIAYLSPEACLGEPLDERSDIWSFGVLLHEMLLQKRPFDRANIPTILHAILHDTVLPLRETRPDIPEALDELVQRMLVKNRDHRTPSVRQVGSELEAILIGYTSTSSGRLPILPEGASPFETPVPQTAVIHHNLPRPANPFIGRQAELAALTRLLTDPNLPLVTIVGPGGMGKTRLALEIGRVFLNPQANEPTQETVVELADISTRAAKGIQQPFPEGIYFVSLAPINELTGMLNGVADALGYRFQREAEAQAELLQLLSAKEMLLIFDNFEHLLANGETAQATKAFITAVLQAAPAVKLCITSRQRLELRSETSFPIHGLDVPQTDETAGQTSAAQLFVQSARHVQFDFQLAKSDLPYVAAICRLVEGMPLGIVLAAAWVDVLPLAEIVAEIQRDNDFLEVETADLPERQRSMRATFAYSWQLLSETERAVFIRLAVFRGGFTRQAAKAVAQTSLRPLSRLASRSLLHYDPVLDRYAIHELLRQFAAEKLVESQQLAAIQAAHSQFYLQMVAASEADLRGKNQKRGLERITADIENVRTAWRWAAKNEATSQLGFAVEGLTLYFYLNAQAAAGSVEFNHALKQLPIETTTLRLRLLNRIYWLAPNDDQFAPAEIETILQHFAAQGDQLEEAIGLDNQAKYLTLNQQFEEALALRQQSVAQLGQLNESFYRSRCYIFIAAHTANPLGLLNVFVEAGEQSYQLTAAAGDWLGTRIALHMKAGHSLFFAGDYRLAAQQYEEAIEMAQKVGGVSLAAQSMPSLSFARFLLGEWEKADRLTQTAVSIFSHRNDPLHLALAKRNLGFLALAAANYDAAQQDFGEAFSLTKEAAVVGTAICGIALTASAQENYAQARTFLQLLWPQTLQGKSYILLLWCFPAAVAVLANAGQNERAVELMALADNHPACPHGWWGQDLFVQQLMASLRKTLPEEAFWVAQARGQALDLAETAVSLLDELAKI